MTRLVPTGGAAPSGIVHITTTPRQGAAVVGAWHLLTARHAVDLVMHLVVCGASAGQQARIVAFAQHLGLPGLIITRAHDEPTREDHPTASFDLTGDTMEALSASELAELLALALGLHTCASPTTQEVRSSP